MPTWNPTVALNHSGPEHLTRRNLGSSLLPESAWPYLSNTLRLSPREMQIVQGVFEDQKEESIAYELGISPHTVNTYFQRLYTKLHVSSRPQLILRVIAEYLALAGSRRDGSFVPMEQPSTSRMSCAQATDEDPAWRNVQATA
jgi:DNA-binding CsgD family transcriptional regulator